MKIIVFNCRETSTHIDTPLVEVLFLTAIYEASAIATD
jgi:hypothetical protein